MVVVVDFVIVVIGFGVVGIEFSCLVWELFTSLRDLPPIVDMDLHLHLLLKNKNIAVFNSIFFRIRIIFPRFEQGTVRNLANDGRKGTYTPDVL